MIMAHGISPGIFHQQQLFWSQQGTRALIHGSCNMYITWNIPSGNLTWQWEIHLKSKFNGKQKTSTINGGFNYHSPFTLCRRIDNGGCLNDTCQHRWTTYYYISWRYITILPTNIGKIGVWKTTSSQKRMLFWVYVSLGDGLYPSKSPILWVHGHLLGYVPGRPNALWGAGFIGGRCQLEPFGDQKPP